MIVSTRSVPQIVVLAAGFSRRLGEPKALARVHGSSLLRRTIRILQPYAGRSRIMVVIPPRSPRYRIGVPAHVATFVDNRQRDTGLSSSVRLGIRRARHAPAVLLLPVDLVQLDRRDIERLIARWRGRRRCLVARRVGAGAATPLILPRCLFARALEVTGERGLRDVVRAIPSSQASLLTLPSAAADVDSAEDLERARRRMRHAGQLRGA